MNYETKGIIPSSLPWLFLGFGLCLLTGQRYETFAGVIEALAFTAAGVGLAFGIAATLSLRLLAVAGVSGLIDSVVSLGGAEDAMEVFTHWPFVLMELVALLLALASFRETSGFVRNVLPRVGEKADQLLVTRSFRDGRDAECRSIAKVVMAVAAIVGTFHGLLAFGLLQLDSLVFGIGTGSGLFGSLVSGVGGLLFEDLVFVAVAIGVLRGIAVTRPALLILGATHLASWYVAVGSLSVISVYALLALMLWSWALITLRPGGAAAPADSEIAATVPTSAAAATSQKP